MSIPTTDTIDLGDFAVEHCTATDDSGTIRVCDPRSWVLWLYAVWSGVPFRSSPYGFEVWEVHRSGSSDDTWTHTVVKYPPLEQVPGEQSMTDRGESWVACPECEGRGWHEVANYHTGEAEQQQCEVCQGHGRQGHPMMVDFKDESPNDTRTDGEQRLAKALAPFGWTCTDEFWQRYYTDPWVFNLANAVERLYYLSEGDPTSIYHEAAVLRVEHEDQQRAIYAIREAHEALLNLTLEMARELVIHCGEGHDQQVRWLTSEIAMWQALGSEDGTAE